LHQDKPEQDKKYDAPASNPVAEPVTENPVLEHLCDSLAPLCQDNPLAMCLLDRKGRLFHANPIFLNNLENKPTLVAIKGQPLRTLFPHHSQRTFKYIETLLSRGKSESLQKILHLGPEQTPTAMHIHVQMLYAPGDKHAAGALITFNEDARWYQAQLAEEKQILTTRIHQLSTDLRDRQSLFKAMMDRSPFGIALLDGQRRVIQLNRTAENMLGIPRSEALGILCNNLFHCFELNQQCPILENKRDIEQQETHCARPKKQSNTFLRSAVLSRERNEDIIIEAFIDITEMKGAQQAKEDAYLAKDNFFAKMSHELRTPLNAIIGYSELLIDDSHPTNKEELKEYAGAIQRGGYDLLHLVNQVWDIAKLISKKIGS